jgi:hypothetical protein
MDQFCLIYHKFHNENLPEEVCFECTCRFVGQNWCIKLTPRVNPMVLSYKARAVKICNAKSSLVQHWTHCLPVVTYFIVSYYRLLNTDPVARQVSGTWQKSFRGRFLRGDRPQVWFVYLRFDASRPRCNLGLDVWTNSFDFFAQKTQECVV